MNPRTSTRPTVEPLEQRESPASVTTSVVYRPFDFTIAGIVRSTDIFTPDGAPAPAQEVFAGNFTLTGEIDYNSAGGQSGDVAYTAGGTGQYTNQDPNRSAASPPTVPYSASDTGNMVFTDTNGAWATTTPFVRTSTQTGVAGNQTVVFAPTPVQLSIDAAKLTVSGGWTQNTNGTITSNGTLVGNVTQASANATDLSVSGLKLIDNGNAGLEARFTVGVTGSLMTGNAGAAPSAVATLYWVNAANETQAIYPTVSVPWNAGNVSADVTGLIPPSAALSLEVKVAAVGWTEQADQTNNTVSAPLFSAAPPTPGDTSTGNTTNGNTAGCTTQAVPPGTLFAVAGGTGGPGVVNVYNGNGSLRFTLNPFGSNWTGGMSVAVGDVNGDGMDDVVVGAGAGGGPRVAVFDGQTGKSIASFYAYEQSFTGGVNVAVGDPFGNKRDDILTGAGAGGGPRVEVFDGLTDQLLDNFYAFNPTFSGGVSVAAGDLNGDGKAEIVVGAGVGGAPRVVVFRASDLAVLSSFYADNPNFRSGVHVGTRTLADGRTVIVTGSNPGTNLATHAFDINGTPIS